MARLSKEAHDGKKEQAHASRGENREAAETRAELAREPVFEISPANFSVML